MIVRTYARRARGLSRSHSDPNLLAAGDDPASAATDGADDEIQEPNFLSQGSTSHAAPSFFFSSQDSSPWSLDPFDLPADEPPKRNGRGAKRGSGGGVKNVRAAATSTLMEAQEFGEMMEHVDEVNFSLDGLRPGQQARIRRASLLSLLSICETAQQRRLLRAQGMAKRIIDSVLNLNFDDSPSTIAAAALFFVLASDAQDDNLLDSPSCIQFLLNLLNPPIVDTVEDKAPSISCRLLGIRKPPTRGASSRGLDSSTTAIMSKVQAILLSCKEIKTVKGDDDGKGRPELSSKWIALLTMEKACLSTVSFEDTFETVRKVGGTFKEKLRELGGLDAICDVVATCYSTMERWLKHSPPPVSDIKDGVAVESLFLLLKCLKIMENATFLSKDNQNHLLGLKSNVICGGVPLSFVGIIISSIKLLSGLSRLQSSSGAVEKDKSNGHLERVGGHFSFASGNKFKKNNRDDQNGTSFHDHAGCSDVNEACPVWNMSFSQKRQRLSSKQSKGSISGSAITISSDTDEHSIKSGGDCSASLSCDGASSGPNAESHKNSIRRNNGRGSHGWISMKTIGSKASFSGLSRKQQISEDVKGECHKGNYDPFAFDGDDIEPSKWEMLAKKKEPSQILQKSSIDKVGDESECQVTMINHEPSKGSNGENHLSVESSCPLSAEEDSTPIEDCLLTAIKVLMNLTNDNHVGCQQIAACGGMETLASLIISHFPLFGSPFSTKCQLKDSLSLSSSSMEARQLNNKRLNDHELDFLVAILGLLVNLVEKDSRNRSRLVLAQVSVSQPGKSEENGNHRDVIPILCSIFLANQGTEDATGEEGFISCDDEASLLQGEREAEMMIIEAYAALLLAFLSTESTKAREAIAAYLPNHNLLALVPVLERFLAFHMTLNMISPETHSAVTEVIESCKKP